MVKASIRAMDATKEFMDKELPQLGTSLDYFAVSGASKRGWTTWLVGAVDPTRVMAIAPVVLDAINFVAVEHHEYRSYGGKTSFIFIFFINILKYFNLFLTFFNYLINFRMVICSSRLY